MKKILFNNELFFPSLNPPIVIFFGDLVKLIINNSLRTLFGAIFITSIVVAILFLAIKINNSLGYNTIPDSPKNIQIFIWAIISISFLPVIYFLLSIFHTIRKSWQWYTNYVKNFGKGNYRNEYNARINEINKNLRNKLLDEKLNKNSNFNLDEEYTKSEVDIFNHLKKKFVKEFLTKKKNISHINIDNQITVIEKEFDEIILRKLKSNM